MNERNKLFSVVTRLHELIEERGFRSINAAARDLGLNTSTLQSILKRDAISRETAEKIGKKWGVEPDWIERGWGPKYFQESPNGLIIDIPSPWSETDESEFTDSRKLAHSSIRARLRILQHDLDLGSWTAFAHACGLPFVRLKEIYEEDRITEEDARIIAGTIGLSYLWILRGEGKRDLKGGELVGQVGFPSNAAAQRVRRAYAPLPADYTVPSFIMVPKAQATPSAGGGLIPEEGFREDQYAFREDWLRSVVTSPYNAILLEVSGDSMSPVLENGDLVLVDQGRTRIVDGAYYVITVGDVLLVKQIRIRTDQKIEFCSVNSQYPTIAADPSEISICGRVIWSGRSYL